MNGATEEPDVLYILYLVIGLATFVALAALTSAVDRLERD